jgi:hypothetical protein
LTGRGCGIDASTSLFFSFCLVIDVDDLSGHGVGDLRGCCGLSLVADVVDVLGDDVVDVVLGEVAGLVGGSSTSVSSDSEPVILRLRVLCDMTGGGQNYKVTSP